MSLSGHQSARSESDVWLTPREIVQALGPFDLDPCTIGNHPWQIAPRWFTREQDGLAQEWRGRVWLNPPFENKIARLWMAKLAQHGNGVALIAARTETRLFFESVWGIASALLFLRGRPHFHYPDGARAKANSGALIVLIAYGDSNAASLKTCGLDGKLIDLRCNVTPGLALA